MSIEVNEIIRNALIQIQNQERDYSAFVFNFEFMCQQVHDIKQKRALLDNWRSFEEINALILDESDSHGIEQFSFEINEIVRSCLSILNEA